MIEKTIDAKAKASLQPLSETREINSRCPKGYRLLTKKKKDKISQEHWDRDKDKAKSYNLSFANTNQP